MCTGGAWRAFGRPSPIVLLASLLALILPSLGVQNDARCSVSDANTRGKRRESLLLHRWRGILLAGMTVLLAFSLQGCLPSGHTVAAWETKPSYIMTYAFLPIGEKQPLGTWQQSTNTAVLNSCGIYGVPPEKQCSGRGLCVPWNTTVNTTGPPMSFCQCDKFWADPECRTRRKSHATAFFLSLFFGMFGADHFYLMEYFSGCLKLATAGGLGVWWIIDIARVGSSPIYARDGFRLAADLPHWLYVGLSVGLFAFLGWLVFAVGAVEYEKRKRKNKLLKDSEDEFFNTRSATQVIRPGDRVGMPTVATQRVPRPYGTMIPQEVKMAAYGNPLASYNAYAEGLRHSQRGSLEQISGEQGAPL